MYAAPDPTRFLAPAELAGTDNPPAPDVTDFARPELGGELTGGAFQPYGGPNGGVDGAGPPPAPPAARAPQRPATSPAGRFIRLLRHVPSYPLQLGHHGDIARVMARSTAVQAPVEVRGSTFRAAPDNPDPTWAEASAVNR